MSGYNSARSRRWVNRYSGRRCVEEAKTTENLSFPNWKTSSVPKDCSTRYTNRKVSHSRKASEMHDVEVCVEVLEVQVPVL